MKLNEQIREYRKKAGLTQEQVANALGVTAPAVNKWERDCTCPDISLLPALARLLQIDMNTLFSFREDLTDLEVTHFVNELAEAGFRDGFEAAMQMAEAKIREFPHCDGLVYHAALILDGLQRLTAIDAARQTEYEKKIDAWFEQAGESRIDRIRIAARYLIAGKALQRKDYETAAAITATLPEDGPDKTVLEVQLLEHEGKLEEAAARTEARLMQYVVKVQNTLYRLVELEAKNGCGERAEQLAVLNGELTRLCGLWDYNANVPYLLIALQRQDKAESIRRMEEALRSVKQPWNPEQCPLMVRLRKTPAETGMQSAGESFARALLTEAEQDEAYAFLRDDPAFQKLLADYRA